jgi:hypothetical protein
MIIWGGRNASQALATGGRYNPATNSWQGVAGSGAPSARAAHSAVWTGSVMVVWGGSGGSGFNTYFSNGARYNPASNTWTAMTTASAPSVRRFHSAVWTGTAMIVWGGYNGSAWLDTGGRYDPAGNSWIATSTTAAPAGRYQHAAVWTGSDLIVWGGFDGSGFLDTGGRYDPAGDSWQAMQMAGAPGGRYYPLGVWTGSRMVVWGGYSGAALQSGGRYNPIADSWDATSGSGAPQERLIHKGVWTGSEMIVWGGTSGTGALATGARYFVDESPDADGDGARQCADCDDTRAQVYAGAPQICDGVNNDCADPSWPALLPGDRDEDGDGLLTCSGDCDDTDAGAWAIPGEAVDLIVTIPGGLATLSWTSPNDAGGTSVRFDTLRSLSGSDFTTAADCVESSDGSDLQSTDPAPPPPGAIVYYLVRAENSCPGGPGPLGSTSAGTPRLGRLCP